MSMTTVSPISEISASKLALLEPWSKAMKNSGKPVKVITDKTDGVPSEYKNAFQPVRDELAKVSDAVTVESFSLGPEFSVVAFQLDSKFLPKDGNKSTRELIGRVVALANELVKTASEAGISFSVSASDLEQKSSLQLFLPTEKLKNT